MVQTFVHSSSPGSTLTEPDLSSYLPDLIGYANLPVESATSVVYGPANPKRRNSPRRDPGISLFFFFLLVGW